jgi:hypothetical protein
MVVVKIPLGFGWIGNVEDTSGLSVNPIIGGYIDFHFLP